MNQKPEQVVALDAGNSATRVLVAEISGPSGDELAGLRFAAFGQAESQGWHKGTIADIEQASASIRKAMDQAQQQAGSALEKVVLGIGGAHLQGVSSRAAVRLSARSREVRRDDVQRLLDEAGDFKLARDREILHLAPSEFVLDEQRGVRNPVGMVAAYLEARVHFITQSVSAAQNVVTAVNRAGLLVESLVGEAFASGEAMLTPEEREMGALLLLIGGPTTAVVAYDHSGLCLTRELPIGGDHFTSDLAIGLHTSRSDAETIKQTFGSVFPGWHHEGASVEIPSIGNQPSRQVPYRLLRDILEPRARELFLLLREELRRADLEHKLPGGVILAGGGARLAGMCDLAERVLDLPSRIGLPPRIETLPDELDGPDFSTLLSLLHFAARVRQQRAPRSPSQSNVFRELLAWTGQK